MKKKNRLNIAIFAILAVIGIVSIFLILKPGTLRSISVAQANNFIELRLQQHSDVVNEDNRRVNNLNNARDFAWIGAGLSSSNAYTGLRFSIPANARNASGNVVLDSARIRLYSTRYQLSPVDVRIFAEDAKSPQTYSANSIPSNRKFLSTYVDQRISKLWKQGFYDIDVTKLIQSLVQAHPDLESVNIIIQNRGNSRIFRRNFYVQNLSDNRAPALVINFKSGSGSSSTTTTTTTGTGSTTTTGSTTGTTGGSTTGGGGGEHEDHGENSHAMGRWEPSTHDTCTKDEHDGYFVYGPDGKKYPTWHSPIHTREDGSTCTFGHEHGRNPSGYQYWDEIKEHFAFDANSDGQLSTSELATAGIPFGYVNEQMMNSSVGFMRHEDHVGHKIEFSNGEGDIGQGTDPFDNRLTGGVVVPQKPGTNGRKWRESGIRCYHFHKIHQGVSTPDALTNNLHELVMHAKCNSTRSDFPTSTSLIAGMLPFGAPGEFTRFCAGDRFQIIKLGTNDDNSKWPGRTGDGMRNIMDRSCVESDVLVPEGRFSNFPYEIWEGMLRIRTADGKVLATNGGAWEVLDALRYYNPNNSNRIGYSADLCYEMLGNRRTRGGACDVMTNFGKVAGIKWDDPRSEFRGVRRGQYILPHTLQNAGGPQYWYTDPLGNNASQTPFEGSIKQRIEPVNATTIGNFNSDPRIGL